MRIDQTRAIEALVKTLPGALNVRNGKRPPKLMPGQEAVKSEFVTNKYMIPVSIEGNGATMIAIRFIYDGRRDMGLIEMSETHILMLAGKEKVTTRSMYRVFKEDEKRLKADITCYKCGHVIEHECW